MAAKLPHPDNDRMRQRLIKLWMVQVCVGIRAALKGQKVLPSVCSKRLMKSDNREDAA